MRPWRWLFVAYLAALTAGTHWPQFQLEGGGMPAADKVVHLIAFGGLAFLLLATRWVRPAWLAALLLLAWATIDEATQSLPGLNRTSSVQDLVASQLGVVVVVAWWWALRPVGGAGNAARLRWQRFLLDDLMRRPAVWLVVGGIGALSAGVALGAAWLVLRLALGHGFEDPESSVPVIALIGGLVGVHAALAALLRRHALREAERMPCLACGASCAEAAFDDRGAGACPRCAAPIRRGTWRAPMELPWRPVMRGTVPAAAAIVAILVIALSAFSLLLIAARHVTALHRIVAGWHNMDSDFRLTIDLAGIGLALAVGVRLYRVRQATIYDRQAERCRGCGHDLRHAPIGSGCGRCPECGLDFAVFTGPGPDG